MFVIIDILIIVIIIIIVLMIYSGFISLLDRNVMAMTQNSVGPGLFLFGICTPIFDGINLILNFGLLILNVELLYLLLITIYSLLFNYSLFFIVPTSNIVLVYVNYGHFIVLAIHSMLSVINTFLVGCFIINTCFVYLATIRTILFTIIGEFCILLVYIYIINITQFSLLNFVVLNVMNTILQNCLYFPICILIIIVICFYLQNMLNIFEFSEAESELVAGTITEFSGVFFCISSLIELSHIILSLYIINSLWFGGFFFNINFIILLIAMFLVPNLLLCRLNINNAILFLLFYVFNYLFIYFLILNFLNLMCFYIM